MSGSNAKNNHVSQDIVEQLATVIQRSQADSPNGVTIVALDGRGGIGKSTLAIALAQRLGASVIDSDDFYTGEPLEGWMALSPPERADRCINWRRQEALLQTLTAGDTANWQAYDWERDDGTLTSAWQQCHPTDIVILEGTFSSRRELDGVINIRLLAIAEPEDQRRRFIEREGPTEWIEWAPIWQDAEDHYFARVMPADSFDAIVDIS